MKNNMEETKKIIENAKQSLHDFCKHYCPEYDHCDTSLGCTTKLNMKYAIDKLEELNNE